MTIEEVRELVNKHILQLQPYSSARDECTLPAEIFIDANENPYNIGYNRYPDPYQRKLKSAVSHWKGIADDKIFISNGSDEVIDLLIRAFCTPGSDQIVALKPSYGMYTVSANVQNVAIRYYPLDEDFAFDTDALLQFLDLKDKILFLCSPNNPSGNTYSKDQIIKIANHFNGIVAVDEAYIDFSSVAGVQNIAGEIPNLVVIQTMSKAMGSAGLRLGMAFMHPWLVSILNKIKPPYNVNSVTQELAIDRIEKYTELLPLVQEIINERGSLAKYMAGLPYVVTVFPSEANFLLVKVLDPDDLYDYLLMQGIVVRNRSKQFQCSGCLRFTIGTPAENKQLMSVLSSYTREN